VVAVPDEQGVPGVLVALASGGLEVGIDLGLQGVGEHLPGSPAGDLVEVEDELLTWELVVVYSVHRCILPADVGASAFLLDHSKGRYTTSFGKSSIHNFRSYLVRGSDSSLHRPTGTTRGHRGINGGGLHRRTAIHCVVKT
jgi:hypothetical protein